MRKTDSAHAKVRCLVTGGGGFIGSHVTDQLISSGSDVTVLDDLSGGFEDNVNPRAEFVTGSITDVELVEKLFSENKFDYVFHLAAYAAEGLSHFIRRFNYTNNLIGSTTLINAAIQHECKSFVFTSSIAVYGAAQVPMLENLKPEPEDPYGISKYAVEMDLMAAHRLFGLNYIIFRPHNVYGERQNIGDKYRNVIGIFMNQVMQGQPCTIFGDGSQTRAFSHIGDIAPAIARSVNIPEAYNNVFNIGADTVYTIRHLAEVVQCAMGKSTGIQYLNAREEVMHAYSDHSKAAQILGSRPTIALEDGITRMAKWAWATGPRSSPKFKAIEIEQNLPESWR
jgi:UDP-glucose 4-epimerase